MAEVFTSSVSARAEIDGTQFSITSAEVSRNIGVQSGSAVIKGFSEDPGSIELDQTLELFITASQADGSAQIQKIFEGNIKRATQDEEGKIEIEAYDIRFKLINKTVKYNLQEPYPARKVLDDIFDDASGISSDDVVIQKSADIPGTETEGKHKYGSGRSGEKLSAVVSDLAKKIGAQVWADVDNTLHVEVYPKDSSQYQAEYIKQINGGDETINTSTTLVQGGAATGNSGLAAANIRSQVSIKSRAERGDQFEDDTEFTYTDDNVITQEEADRTAGTQQFTEELRRDAGTVQIVGDTEPRLFDRVVIPELRQQAKYQLFADAVEAGVLENIYDNEYTITGVEHVINADDGYTTTLQLGPNASETAEQLSGAAAYVGNAIAQRIKSKDESD